MPEPWGGHANGRIPLAELRQLQHATGPTGKPVTHLRLRRDASLALDRLLVLAAADGYDRYITDAYRTYATQVVLKASKGVYAATPGTSNHGWAMAGDMAYSASPKSFGRWLWANQELARRHGWYAPSWTHDGRGIEEPWHWEYDHTLDRHRNEEPPVELDQEDDVIRDGSPSDRIEWLQDTLNDWLQWDGLWREHEGRKPRALDPLQVDGEWGPKTRTAVQSLQRAAGMKANGVADAATCAALVLAIAYDRQRVHSTRPHANA